MDDCLQREPTLRGLGLWDAWEPVDGCKSLGGPGLQVQRLDKEGQINHGEPPALVSF